MKFLLVFAVLLIGYFVWRSSRISHKQPPPKPAPPKAKDKVRALEMVQCAVCGLHCPKTDSVAGKHGVYCTAQHRQQAEP